ncbi:hypothetical protein V6N11_048686 [Hibiscus sabdariffa]|uniref:Uncharacterized protein n=1 Tax=Hibiscus sabdariffa TaxID=183260 RepID=A0ABR2PWJ2_9ROSI
MAFLLFFFLSLLSFASSASRDHPKTFIVRVQNDAKPSIFTTHKHWYESSLSSVLSPSTPTQVLHVYDTVFHGFSAKLTPTEALKLQTLPHVVAVIPEQVRRLHTTRSPHFLGLKTTDTAGLLKESDFGSDLVIGVIDTASAGNGGPGGLTVTNVAPWVATVGAGTIDRDFPAEVKLGNGKVVPGVSIYNGPGLTPGRMYPLVYAGTGDGDGYSSSLCLEGSLDPEFVKGKIVVCDRGINSRAAKGEVVKKAGGIGMILANGAFDGEGLVADCHVLPATAVGAANGDEIRGYIDSASKSKSPATATIVFHGTRLVKLHPGGTSMKSGSIVWSDGKHNVTSPLIVTMQQPL